MGTCCCKQRDSSAPPEQMIHRQQRKGSELSTAPNHPHTNGRSRDEQIELEGRRPRGQPRGHTNGGPSPSYPTNPRRRNREENHPPQERLQPQERRRRANDDPYSSPPPSPLDYSTPLGLREGIYRDHDNVYIAISDYNGQPGDLSFRKGDKMILLDDDGEQYWVMARDLRTRREGYIPRNHVEKYNSDRAEP